MVDDNNFIGGTVLTIKNIFNNIDKPTEEEGLKVNEDRIKYMCVNRMGRRNIIGQNVTVNIYNFKRVKRFKYLGSTVTADNDVTKEINQYSPQIVAYMHKTSDSI